MEPLVWIGRLRPLLCALLLALMVETSPAAPPISTADPNCFFTTVASRLLSSQMGIKLSCIQVYPTCQYTPAVNRLLQVTANIYDATTTNYYPSVFRPVLWKTNTLDSYGNPVTNIYIVGYQNVPQPLTNNTLPIFTTPTDPDDPNIPFGLSNTNNIYGIPWILGAKKGLPNFNALEMVNAFRIERELQFTRNSVTPVSSGSFPYGRTYATNQMYLMSISNYLGAEFWNSYASNYDGPVIIVASDALSVTMVMTNQNGASEVVPPFNNYQEPLQMFGVTNLISWSGYLRQITGDPSFVLPLMTNTTWLTNSVFYYGPGTYFGYPGPGFVPTIIDPSNYLDSGTPPLPQFGLIITNRLQAYIIDTNNCLLDYVQLDGMESRLNINQAIADNSQGYSTGLWSTNYFLGTSTPQGVIEQFLTSSIGGTVPTEDNDGGSWNGSGGNSGYTDTGAQQAFFSAFFSPSDTAIDASDGGILITNFELAVQAPFTPSRMAVQRMVYAANDPLVHYLASDLSDLTSSTNGRTLDNPTLSKLGILSDRYMPWGNTFNQLPSVYYFSGSPIGIVTDYRNPYNLAYKDPWVFSSDDWNFPSNETLNASWLGQVHRGTPWQTVYLKSSNILEWAFSSGPATWAVWTGDTNAIDAFAMAPATDWHMASYLASLFNTNNYASLFSVNSSPAAWESLLNGMTVVSNDLPNTIIQNIPILGFEPYIISSNSPQATLIAGAIQPVQAAQPGQFFTNVGDIFAIPQLSTASPYLNVALGQLEHGLNDEAYEAIPQQLLPLLRVDSIGSVVPANGQTVIQFTGDDNHAYAVQVSPDLKNWTTIGTNCPVGGSFTITNAGTVNAQFYRTVLLQ